MGLWDKLKGAFGGGGDGGQAATPEEHFAAEVEAAIREAFPGAAVRRLTDAYGFGVNRGQSEQSAFLQNVFRETRDVDPERRRMMIGRYVRALAPPDTAAMTWEQVRPKLVPLLRTPGMFRTLPGMTLDKLPIQRPFAPFLTECVGIDSDDGIAYAFPGLLGTWSVSADDLFAAATANARSYFTDDIESYDPTAPYPLWYVSRDDSYESSRLLVPGWLASFEGRVDGRPVAIVPHRSLLVVGGDGDERCLRRLVDAAKAEFEASPRSISPALYSTAPDGKVVPLRLPDDHPLAADVAVGHHLAAMAEYNGQKAFLEEHPKEDIFVATYSAMKAQKGGVFSYSVWSKGVPTLLPETDYVMLNSEPGQKGAEVLRVPWAALRATVAGALQREPDVEPPRWRTGQWPDAQTLATLRTSGAE